MPTQQRTRFFLYCRIVKSGMTEIANPFCARIFQICWAGSTSPDRQEKTRCFRLLFSDSLSIFRIFLPIHSSVGYRNPSLSHQLIENSSRRIRFNNSSGNIRIQQLHLFPPLVRALLDFSCACTSTEFRFFSVGPEANENNPIGEFSGVKGRRTQKRTNKAGRYVAQTEDAQV